MIPTAARELSPSRTITAVQIGMTAAKANRGGLDRYFFSLARALPAHGVDVRGLVVGDATDLDPHDPVACFAPERLGLLRRWSALRGAVAGAMDASDVVVSHFAPYAFGVLDTIRTQPLVVHFHGPWALEGAAEGAGRAVVATKRIIEQIVYRRGSRFIVLSQAFSNILQRQYHVPADRIRVVPGGVDLQQFQSALSRAAARERLGWPLGRPTVLSVRRLVHAKGVENLIDATVAIRRAIPDILVVIAGTGPLAGELARRVADLGLSDSVRFTGFVPEADLPTMYRAADLFVVPTVTLEGFGLVVIEALACGTPVLVTPVAGLPEVIVDLDPALVLPDWAAPALAQGISDALSGALSLPDSDACIAYAQRFDWSHIAGRVAAVYREVAT